MGERGWRPVERRERYDKQLSDVCMEMFQAIGAIFEQEHLRFINMFAALRGSEPGG